MLDAENWKVDLQSGLSDLVDQAVRAGVKSDEVFVVMAEMLEVVKQDWNPDTNLAEEPRREVIEEPANDWPAAVNELGKGRCHVIGGLTVAG